MIANLGRWGNSYAVRLPKSEVERLGLVEGAPVDVTLRPVAPTGRVPLDDRPLYRDPDRRLSERVDEILYGDEA